MVRPDLSNRRLIMNVNEIRELTASELDFVSGGVTTSFDSGFSWSGVMLGAWAGAIVFNAIGFISGLIDEIFG
jgi:hypothetical protein